MLLRRATKGYWSLLVSQMFTFSQGSSLQVSPKRLFTLHATWFIEYVRLYEVALLYHFGTGALYHSIIIAHQKEGVDLDKKCTSRD